MDSLLSELESNWVYLLVSLIVMISAFYFWPTSPKRNPSTFSRSLAASGPSTLSAVSSGHSFNKSKPQPTQNTKSNGPPLKVLWGSQTGTAEDFSEQIVAEARKIGFNAESIDIEEYDKDDLAEEKYVLFVVATYGEGEPTDNAKEMYEWLSDTSLDHDLLSGLQYAVFGLGNKTYEHFNAIGQFFDRRVGELGAKRFYTFGEGDDDGALEEEFLAWKKDLWPVLCKMCGIEYAEEADSLEVAPRTKLVMVENKFEKREHGLGSRVGRVFDQKHPFIAEIIINRELHGSTSDRSCRHIEFEVGNRLSYQVGDHLGVFAYNSSDLVLHLVRRLGADNLLDKPIALHSVQPPIKTVLGPATLRTALTELLDITTPPRKALLRALVQYVEDPDEKQFLLTISSADEDSLPVDKQYANWIKASRRTIGEVLDALPSLKPPLAHVLELLPALAPRYYSISSSPLLHPTRIHITCVLTRFTTGTGRLHDGVASTHLLSLVPSDEKRFSAPIFVRKSQFRPPSSEKPLVMVGPGTGIAPFRGFIQHRPLSLRAEQQLGESVLLFGCRGRLVDYLYEDELRKAAEDGHLTNLLLAFSREQDQKVYVQDRLREEKDRIWDIINNKGGHFYICGDASRMAPDVRGALEEVIMHCGGYSQAQAVKYISTMQEQGRYSTDVWF